VSREGVNALGEDGEECLHLGDGAGRERIGVLVDVVCKWAGTGDHDVHAGRRTAIVLLVMYATQPASPPYDI